MKALWDSIVRTVTPIAVGAVISFFVTRGIELDPEFEGALFLVITGALQAVYYIAVRLFEQYVSPKLGWFIGLPKQPVAYVEKPAVTAQVDGAHNRSEEHTSELQSLMPISYAVFC